MSVVYVKNKKTGTVYAYESEAKWVPDFKQSRPVRTYLGRVDPITHEIIPTAGRKGRRKKDDDPINDPHIANSDYKALYEESLKKNIELEAELKAARHQSAFLTKRISDAQKQLESIKLAVQKALETMADN